MKSTAQNRHPMSLLQWRSPARALAVAIALASLLASPYTHASPKECAVELTSKVEFATFEADFLSANKVSVTGEFIYPLAMVINNFDLTPSQIVARYPGLKVLSIGEGVSHFVPFLLSIGAQAQGLDLWYDRTDFPHNFTGQIMREYMLRYGDHLIQGDGRNVPLPADSLDAVFSHLLVNNVGLVQQKAILKDIVRVLKRGGEARIYGFMSDELRAITTFLNKTYNGSVSSEFKPIAYQLNFRGNRSQRTRNLLILQKL